MLVGIVIQLGAQVVPLVLLWQYMRAVQAREDNPLTF